MLNGIFIGHQELFECFQCMFFIFAGGQGILGGMNCILLYIAIVFH